MSIKIASTGSIIKMYLESNDVSVYKLAESSGVSLRTILRVLNDERPLDFDVAAGINKLIPGISIDFLLTYDTRYQLQKRLVEKDSGGVDVSKTNSAYHMKKLYHGIANDELALFEKAKKIFGIDNIINGCKVDVSNLSFCFSRAKGESYNTHLVWLKAAYEECLEQSQGNLLSFNRENFNNLFAKLKSKTFTADIDSTIYNIKSFCKKCGINFYFRKSIPGARVKAVTVRDEKGYIYIFVSDLFKCIENLWLSFIHECIHIKDNDFDKSNKNLVNDDQLVDENYVDEESILFFLPDCELTILNDIDAIILCANKNECPIGIAMEIMRFKTHDYGNKNVNKYIHYYK